MQRHLSHRLSPAIMGSPSVRLSLWSSLAVSCLVWLAGAKLWAEEPLFGVEGEARPVASLRRSTPLEVRYLQPQQQPDAPPAAGQSPEADAQPAGVVDNYLRPIGEVGLAFRLPDDKLPPNYAAPFFQQAGVHFQFAGESRPWGMSLFSWEATALCHRPLYFEEVNLERYGNSLGILQPAVSAADLVGRVLVFPYLLGATPPRECIYTLGQGRPGNYMPYYLHRPPVSVRGGLLQTAAVTGMAYIVP